MFIELTTYVVSVDRSLQKRSFGGWCAKDSDNHPFLQVNLKTSTVITALATQGLPLRDNSALRYKLNYSCDGKVWFEYQDGKVIHFTLEKQWELKPRRGSQQNSIQRGSAQMSNPLPFYIPFLTERYPSHKPSNDILG